PRRLPNPVRYFGDLAAKAPVPAMKQWLETILGEEDWQLNIHHVIYPGCKPLVSAGYEWWTEEKVVSGEISPPHPEGPPMSVAILDRFFSVIDSVRWMPFGMAGGLFGCKPTNRLSQIEARFPNGEVDPDKAVMLGMGLGGDCYFYTPDDLGGCVACSGKGHVIGTIEDLLEWVFSGLNSGDPPEFDYGWGDEA
ncbi:MAG: hypothetical protein AAF514_17590, partial [Verrucomicrobiota bacterium]